MFGRGLGLWVVVALVVAGCSNGGVVTVRDARIGEPTGPNAALYFTASGADDRLLGASTPIADSVHLHETRHDPDGTVVMSSVGELLLKAGEELVLQPGGFHLMLIDVDHSVSVGDKVEVTLTWEVAGELAIEAEVVAPGDTIDHDGG